MRKRKMRGGGNFYAEMEIGKEELPYLA